MNKKKLLLIDKEIVNLRGKVLEQRIQEYLDKREKIICKALNRRPVYINEYLFFTDSRNSPDKNHRKQSFFSAIDLIKKAKKEDVTNVKYIGGKVSYEMKGITRKGNLVGVHILEFSTKKDKRLKLLSTFWDNKKA